MLTVSQEWETATLVVELPSRAVIAHHVHDDHQLVYASEGVIAVSTETGTWIAPGSSAIWIPAGAAHQHRAYGPTKLHGIGLSPERNPLGLDEPTVVTVTPLLRELITAYTTRPSDEVAANAEQHGRLLEVLIDQLAASPQEPIRLPSPRDPRLVEACRVVEGDLISTFGLDELARRSRSSARTLSRLFREEMRMSYVQWRTQLRLYHALRMLADGTQVGTVAHRCGWQSPSSFVATFYRFYGHTPGQHLRQE